jgi:hypothetical protein
MQRLPAVAVGSFDDERGITKPGDRRDVVPVGPVPR